MQAHKTKLFAYNTIIEVYTTDLLIPEQPATLFYMNTSNGAN